MRSAPEQHDEVADGVAEAAGCFEVVAGEAAELVGLVAGKAVEVPYVVASVREQSGAIPGVDVLSPALHHRGEGVCAGVGDLGALVAGVPADSGTDVAGPELGEGFTFVGVALTQVPVDEPQHVGVGGHSCLVEDHDCPAVQGELAAVQASQQGLEHAGFDVGFASQGLGGLPAGRGAVDGEAGGLEGSACRVHDGGLAGTGNTDDHVGGRAGTAHVVHGEPLTGRQPAPDRLLLRGDGSRQGPPFDGGSSSGGKAFDGGGDGLFGGEDFGGGVVLLVGRLDPGQR